MLQCVSTVCRFLVYRDVYKGQNLTESDKCPWCGSKLSRSGKEEPVSTGSPLVSIVVPIYKGESWLPSLAQTIREQTYSNIEVVLSGDDCDPASLNGIQHFRGMRCVFVGSPRHQGISITTNRGIIKSTGAYILHMDQDDQLRQNCVERLVKELQDHPELGAVYGAQELQRDGETTSSSSESFRRLSMLGHNIMGHPVMVRRQVMLRCLLDPRDDLAQDAGYNLRLSEECQIGRVQDVLYIWNLHGENPSLTKNAEQRRRLAATSVAAVSRRLVKPSVCFVLPGLGVCGGIRLVLEAANRLADQGWDIWVADLTRGGLCTTASRLDPPAPPECFVPLRVPVVEGIPQWCDVAVSTGWETVEAVLEHERTGRGVAAWYIQNWEVGWHDTSAISPTGIHHVVTCAPHLQARLKTHGVEASIIPSAVDLDQFPFRPRHSGCAPAPSRILIPWREQSYKNPMKLLAIMRLLRDSGRELTLLSPMPPKLVSESEFQGSWKINPPQDDLRMLYSLSDMTLTASQMEGHSVITLEAMAVGSIPIVQSVGNEETVVDGTGILLPEDATPEDYVQAVAQMEAVRCSWRVRRSTARAHIENNFTWDKVVALWEAFLLSTIYACYGEILDRVTHGLE